MRYAIYFTWNDGYQDSFNVDNVKDLDMSLKELLSYIQIKSISYCSISADGEYSKRKYVL